MATEHIVPPAPHPNAAPNLIEPTAETVTWNPSVHLQLEAPAYLKMLTKEKLPGGADTDLIQFPVPVSHSSDTSFRTTAKALDQQATVPFNGLAFSAPFRLLSDAGVKALREVIAMNEKHACALPSRAAKALRGLGYRSQFIRDFNSCPVIRAHLSQMAGTPLGPHHMPMNLSQTNFGEIGANKPVDQWHIDSVPYVMVLLLSDATGMEGGKLQVANMFLLCLTRSSRCFGCLKVSLLRTLSRCCILCTLCIPHCSVSMGSYLTALNAQCRRCVLSVSLYVLCLTTVYILYIRCTLYHCYVLCMSVYYVCSVSMSSYLTGFNAQ